MHYTERCNHMKIQKGRSRVYFCFVHTVDITVVTFHKCSRQMVCFLHKITRNLPMEWIESNIMWSTLIFGFRFTRNLPSEQLQSLWFIAAVTVMCTDHQTEWVLQWLLASVGIFALFLQTLPSVFYKDLCFLSVSVYSGTRSNWQHCKTLPPATAGSLTISGTSLLLATWADKKLDFINSIWIFTAVYLSCYVVTSYLILFVHH